MAHPVYLAETVEPQIFASLETANANMTRI